MRAILSFTVGHSDLSTDSRQASTVPSPSLVKCQFLVLVVALNCPLKRMRVFISARLTVFTSRWHCPHHVRADRPRVIVNTWSVSIVISVFLCTISHPADPMPSNLYRSHRREAPQ